MNVLDKVVAEIEDVNARDILSIVQKRRQAPRDCVTDGSLEKLARYIVELERKVKE